MNHPDRREGATALYHLAYCAVATYGAAGTADDVVAALLQAGADPTLRDSSGLTAEDIVRANIRRTRRYTPVSQNCFRVETAGITHARAS